MIEFFVPLACGMFLHCINTNKNENTYQIHCLHTGRRHFVPKWAYELPATGVNIGKATYTFTGVIFVGRMLYGLVSIEHTRKLSSKFKALKYKLNALKNVHTLDMQHLNC